MISHAVRISCLLLWHNGHRSAQQFKNLGVLYDDLPAHEELLLQGVSFVTLALLIVSSMP